jgi:hypothetical protein
MNPNAKEFVPAFTMNPFAKEFVSKNNKTKTLDTLSVLSTTVAENVLFELNPVHKELLAQRALEALITKIPTITSVDDLEQVAQISTTDGVYELFWNGTHAILDNRISSWQFPDMSIRDIIHYYFDDEITISPDSSIDLLASSAPAIQLLVTPFSDPTYWSEHPWKSIP